MQAKTDFQDEAAGISEEFSWKTALTSSHVDSEEESQHSDEEIGDEDEDDFSFTLTGADGSPISADDVFQDGQIKPTYPVFDQSLLFASDLPHRPAVKKVFVETQDSTEGWEGEAAGPSCAWSGKAVEASPDACKKSNSTGFSKIWRFRELVNRSNSDGRDAFVFLNGSSTTTGSKSTEEKVDKSERSSSSSEKKKNSASEAKATVAGGKVKAKKRGKGEKASLSAHEMHYVQNRALREGERRRSYLPYKPGLGGFFTNVNGGLSRNLNPF